MATDGRLRAAVDGLLGWPCLLYFHPHVLGAANLVVASARPQSRIRLSRQHQDF